MEWRFRGLRGAPALQRFRMGEPETIRGSSGSRSRDDRHRHQHSRTHEEGPGHRTTRYQGLWTFRARMVRRVAFFFFFYKEYLNVSGNDQEAHEQGLRLHRQ